MKPYHGNVKHIWYGLHLCPYKAESVKNRAWQ